MTTRGILHTRGVSLIGFDLTTEEIFATLALRKETERKRECN
jgi:hypothetical protein